jgi:ATP adenylyltransferase
MGGAGGGRRSGRRQDTGGDVTTCTLCRALDDAGPVFEDRSAVVIPDAFPLSPGHHLIVIRRHEPDFFSLDSEEVASFMHMLQLAHRFIDVKWQPDGFNVGVNVGEAAGQTIPHVHLHVIPRYTGDVEDPRGGMRLILPEHARYWELDQEPRPDL